MKNLLIIGGSGQLGKIILSTFKTKSPKWNTFNLDFRENNETEKNFIIKENWKLNPEIIPQIQTCFDNSTYDCIVNVAGGWQMEGLKSKNILISTEEMMNMNFYSSILAAHLASQYLKKKSLLVLTGAFMVYKQNNPGINSY